MFPYKNKIYWKNKFLRFLRMIVHLNKLQNKFYYLKYYLMIYQIDTNE